MSSEEAGAVTFFLALRGYDVAETDELFDAIAATLSRHETGLDLRPHHLTAQQVRETELGISMPGYEVTEVTGFLDWVVWTLRMCESGKGPERLPATYRKRRSVELSETDSSSGTAVDQRNVFDDSRSPATESPIDPEDSSEERRQMTSEELLEQAKKWLNR